MEGLAGAVIGGYRLDRYLGSGGYGEVFLAQEPSTTPSGARVVVKALRADQPSEDITALLHATQALGQIRHPHLLPVLASGVDGSAAYIAMPYLPMGSIETLLREHPATGEQAGVSAALVAPIVTQISGALSVAHAAGVVHGDLKPGNIFLRTQPGQAPQAVVSDFGQAALVRAALAGAFPISPNAQRSPIELALQLSAPEQLAGAPLSASDQFTLAAIACLLLTGRAPARRGADAGQSRWAQGASMLSEECAALLPRAAVPALHRALAANPAERFDDITAFARALDDGLSTAKGISLAAPHRRQAAPAPSPVPAPTPLANHPALSAASAVSYAPTGIALADNVLARVEALTHGKAGVLQRAFTYVFIGGIAAVINLAVLYLVYNVLKLPFASNLNWLIAFIVAAEVSTMSNFVLNDRITFSHLPGHARSWWARCLRFHSTSAAGTIATLVMSFAFKTWLGMSALIAEAVAIMLALILNFTMHHLWTYRQIKGDDDSDAVQVDGSLVVSEARGQAR